MIGDVGNMRKYASVQLRIQKLEAHIWRGNIRTSRVKCEADLAVSEKVAGSCCFESGTERFIKAGI